MVVDLYCPMLDKDDNSVLKLCLVLRVWILSCTLDKAPDTVASDAFNRRICAAWDRVTRHGDNKISESSAESEFSGNSCVGVRLLRRRRALALRRVFFTLKETCASFTLQIVVKTIVYVYDMVCTAYAP